MTKTEWDSLKPGDLIQHVKGYPRGIFYYEVKYPAGYGQSIYTVTTITVLRKYVPQQKKYGWPENAEITVRQWEKYEKITMDDVEAHLHVFRQSRIWNIE